MTSNKKCKILRCILLNTDIKVKSIKNKPLPLQQERKKTKRGTNLEIMTQVKFQIQYRDYGT